MVGISITILFIATILTLGMGVLVFSQQPSRRDNQYFLMFAVSTCAWIGTNALFAVAPVDSRFAIGLVSYGAAVLLSTFFFLFTIALTNFKISNLKEVVAIVGGVAVAIWSMTPGTVGIGIDAVDNLSIETNLPALIVYGVILVAYLLGGVLVLWGRLKTTRIKQEKSAITSMLVGLVIAMFVGLVCNLALPVIGNYNLVQLGPIGVIFLVAASTYASVRHRLFDIRMAAVRTFAYSLTLGVLALLYFAIALAITLLIFQDDTVENPARIGFANMLIAITLAFLFQPIKEFFDRLTSRVFFHDRYNSNDFIAGLGDILTSTTQLRTLLKNSLTHITTTLKSSYGVFVVMNENKPPVVVTTDGKREFSDTDIDMLDHLSKTAHSRMILASDISEDRVTMHRVFAKHKIAIIIPLSHAKSTIGYLILGEHKANGYTKRDINILSSITNELIIAIQNARSLQALRDFNVHLQQSIEAATKELRQSNSKLRKLDETKDEFVSMASHQLRTPLTSIKGYISMVLDGDVGKITPQQHKLLSEAFTSSERMVRLISDFLNVSRIQTGRFMIDTSDVDLKTVVGEEVEALQQMATSHGMKLQYIAPDVVPSVRIDEDKTRQVIMNFIDNAIYYSPEDTTITVKLKADNKFVSLEVHDKGIGVPKDKQDRLFTKFYRADNARKQRPDGTGVGLYLAKKVVEAQGGEIIFHSHVGLGSVFGFKLPINRK